MEFLCRSPSVEKQFERDAVGLEACFPDGAEALQLLQNMLDTESRYQQNRLRRFPLTIRDDRDVIVQWMFAVSV